MGNDIGKSGEVLTSQKPKRVNMRGARGLAKISGTPGLEMSPDFIW